MACAKTGFLEERDLKHNEVSEVAKIGPANHIFDCPASLVLLVSPNLVPVTGEC